MPPRGVKAGSKRARQYEHIKESGERRGMSNDRAEEMAASTVNEERSEAGASSRGGGSRKRGSRKKGSSRKSSVSRKSASRGGSKKKAARKSTRGRTGGRSTPKSAGGTRKSSARKGSRKVTARRSTGGRTRSTGLMGGGAAGAATNEDVSMSGEGAGTVDLTREPGSDEEL